MHPAVGTNAIGGARVFVGTKSRSIRPRSLGCPPIQPARSSTAQSAAVLSNGFPSTVHFDPRRFQDAPSSTPAIPPRNLIDRRADCCSDMIFPGKQFAVPPNRAVASLRSVIVFRNAIEPDRFKSGTQPSAARSAAAFVQHRRSPHRWGYPEKRAEKDTSR